MQLLKITNVPIKYQYQIERARLEMKTEPPRYDLERERSHLSTKSENIEVRLDTSELRASLNLRSPTAFAQNNGQQGVQAAQQATGEYVQMGNQMAQAHEGVTIAQMVTQKMLQQPETYTTFLPSVGPQISWTQNKLDMSYDPGSLKFDWKVMRNSMDYVPGKFSMSILQYPKVSIEYLGEPSYVPPSANPNYQGESA